MWRRGFPTGWRYCDICCGRPIGPLCVRRTTRQISAISSRPLRNTTAATASRRSRSGRCHRRSLRRSWEDRLLRKPGGIAGKPRASCVDMSMSSSSFDRPVGQTVQLGIAELAAAARISRSRRVIHLVRPDPSRCRCICVKSTPSHGAGLECGAGMVGSRPCRRKAAPRN